MTPFKPLAARVCTTYSMSQATCPGKTWLGGFPEANFATSLRVTPLHPTMTGGLDEADDTFAVGTNFQATIPRDTNMNIPISSPANAIFFGPRPERSTKCSTGLARTTLRKSPDTRTITEPNPSLAAFQSYNMIIPRRMVHAFSASRDASDPRFSERLFMRSG